VTIDDVGGIADGRQVDLAVPEDEEVGVARQLADQGVVEGGADLGGAGAQLSLEIGFHPR
jgi:hypothetical protein